MATQLPIDWTLRFDPGEAKQRKADGIERVASANPSFLKAARSVAFHLAEQLGQITADEVREACERRGIQPSHYNAWGALFNDPRFEWTGSFAKSRNVRGHQNLLRVWRLKR